MISKLKKSLAASWDTGQGASATRRLPAFNKFLKPAPKHWSSMQPRFQIAGHYRITASSGSEPLDNLVGRWLHLHRSFKAQPTAPSSLGHGFIQRLCLKKGSIAMVLNCGESGRCQEKRTRRQRHKNKLLHQAITNFLGIIVNANWPCTDHH